MNQAVRAVRVGLVVVFALMGLSEPCQAVDRTWIGGNGIWTDGAGSGNWSPSGEPGIGDNILFNSANTVTLGSANSVQSISLSNGIVLNTGGFNLFSNGTITLANANTELNVSGATSHLQTWGISGGATTSVRLSGGTITIDRDAFNGVFNLNGGGNLTGHGTISLLDAPDATATLFATNGTVTVRSEPLIPFTAPPPGTLLITAPSTHARVDLDGSISGAIIHVLQNQTLKVVPVLFDSFNGSMNLHHNATYEGVAAWELSGGSLNVSTGAIPASPPDPAIAADVAYIAGGTLTHSGGQISVLYADGALQINAPYIQSGGTLSIAGRLIVQSNSRINAGTVTGGGSLVIGNAGTLSVSDGVNLNVKVRNEGALSPGGMGIAHLSMDEFAQAGSGRLYMQLSSATIGDKLNIDGSASFGGELRVGRADPVIPVPGSSLTTIEYGSYSGGTFTIINETGLAGLSFTAAYNATAFTLTPMALVQGDADLNGVVDARDLLRLANHWLGSGNWLFGDFSGDGLVNQIDLTILAQNWQNTVSGPAFGDALAGLNLDGAIVPEPAVAMGVAVWLLALPRFRRR